MLRLEIQEREFFDNTTNQFISLSGSLCLEHSLASIAKWEAKFHKPFFSKEPKTTVETLSYIQCMVLGEIEDDRLFYCLGPKEIETVEAYIADPMTARKQKKQPDKPARELVTSETVYYWMTALSIPFECQYWHFNRLTALIRLCVSKQEKPQKMSRSELAQRNAALNAARRARLHSRG